MNKHDRMESVRNDVLALKESPLYEYRIENNYIPVIGEGSLDAKIMFIGEAPGKQEAITGKPFCGASGKVLDAMLEHVGLIREDVYITSIVKDRPQDNRDPSPSEISLYRPFLIRQLQIINPEVIVTLGRFAMSEMLNVFRNNTNQQPISTAHGSEISLTDNKTGRSLTLVPLYHPAVALYNGGMRVQLIKDFEVLKKFM